MAEGGCRKTFGVACLLLALVVQGHEPIHPRLQVSVGAGSTSVAAADLDADGDLDVVVGNDTGDSVTVLAGNGAASLTAVQALPVGNAPRPAGRPPGVATAHGTTKSAERPLVAARPPPSASHACA